MITKDDAVTAGNTGKTLYHMTLRGSDKKPTRCRVNGRCKTWKTRPTEFQLPVKHGLRDCFYITPANADNWALTEEEAMATPASPVPAHGCGHMQGRGTA